MEQDYGLEFCIDYATDGMYYDILEWDLTEKNPKTEIEILIEQDENKENFKELNENLLEIGELPEKELENIEKEEWQTEKNNHQTENNLKEFKEKEEKDTVEIVTEGFLVLGIGKIFNDIVKKIIKFKRSFEKK